MSNFDTQLIFDEINLRNIDTLKVDSVYYLGATDSSCFKKFFWCSGQEVKITDYKWISGQPNYLLLLGGQHCITQCNIQPAFLRIGHDTGLNDWECYEANQYLCE